MEQSARLGVDIGGTFTDVVLELGESLFSAKVLTKYSAPEEAIVAGMQQVCDKAGIAPEQISQVIHGTTLATNALIERRGAKTALITTRGFRDVIEMRTESRFEQYDLNLRLPEPLLPRNSRYVVSERMDADGGVLIPLARAEVEDLAAELGEARYKSVAIALLHAYANDAHERMVAEVLAEALPGVMLSLSSQVSPQMREYERFNTTIANAYIKPLMASYLNRLKGRLAAEGADCPVFLMHSGGGIMSLESAAEFPVRLVESGPAGGAIFAADIAARHGVEKALSFDMGGTTAKICLIKNETPKTARVFEVARSYRFKKGSGMPISIPVIDMVEIGAGGGSLARVDAMGQIRVGPESAGSEPGPACYGRGGTEPAVTDADLMLGKLDADGFAGGAIALSPGRAEAALAEHLGEKLDMDATGAAWGLTEVVDETMANAARVHAVENGEDLSGFTMIAFGGAAPLHAGRLCEKLGISRLLIPLGAGVGSAIGFLRAPFSFEATRAQFARLSAFDRDAVAAALVALHDAATAFVRSCAPGAEITTRRRCYMRYAGQGWEIPVPLSADDAVSPDPVRLRTLFEAEYEALFARTVTGMEIEVTTWAVTAATPTPEVTPLPELQAITEVVPRTTREIFEPAVGESASAASVARAELAPGAALQGPALLTETETTIVVPASLRALVLADGTIDVSAHG
ncbi:MAG: hydantoinase/oxoprolinase family protein [Pseudomonadota bacterium]